jgi:hypothetical protein
VEQRAYSARRRQIVGPAPGGDAGRSRSAERSIVAIAGAGRAPHGSYCRARRALPARATGDLRSANWIKNIVLGVLLSIASCRT